VPNVILSAVMPPLVAELYAQGRRPELERVLRATATAAALPSLAVTAVLAAAGGPLLGIVYGGFYRQGALVLALLSLGQLATVWFGSCGIALVMSGQHQLMLALCTATGVLTIAAELALVGPAGIVGVAVGFGSQNLVRDFISGIFMLMEDQYGVGDVVDAGPATGTVEGVGLRTTRLRDVSGTLWHIPNGEIRRVGNRSQGWARALVDVEVAYSTDLEAATRTIERVAHELYVDEQWAPKLLEQPEVWGVEELGPDGIRVRLVAKTRPLEQWNVARELRARLKVAFDQAGIAVTAQKALTSADDQGQPAA
jgi:hypothetical protein